MTLDYGQGPSEHDRRYAKGFTITGILFIVVVMAAVVAAAWTEIAELIRTIRG
jgi:hypothetical protein